MNKLIFMEIIKYLSFISIGVLIVNFVVSLILGHISDYYNPNIKATYSGFMASILGISLASLLITVSRFNDHKKIFYILGIAELILSGLAIIFEFLLGFYLGAWACLVWFFLGIGMMLVSRKQQQKVNSEELPSKSIPLNTQGQSNSFSIDEPNPVQTQNNLSDSNKKCCNKNRCCFCCYSCCLVTTLLLITLFTCCSIAYFAKLNQYPALCEIFQIQGEGNRMYSIHAYCVGQEQATRPTIILEHGGGSNSIAFRELGKALSEKNWKVCAYDRLGYGRSSGIPRYLTNQQKAKITYQVINKVLQSHANKKIIFGGWSAGVEISQVYAYLYPADVEGLIFLDGYPDYLYLMAIEDNKTEVVSVGTLGILGITRVIEPLGLGFVVGGSQLADSESSQYYQAYYQTGYFWESQYFDVANPYPATSWLTSKAGSARVPYPDSKISLNWPDISVPLLVLPANNTLNDGLYQKIYRQQCQKYLDKCGSASKEIKVMEGDHGFVLKSPAETAYQINRFFEPLF